LVIRVSVCVTLGVSFGWIPLAVAEIVSLTGWRMVTDSIKARGRFVRTSAMRCPRKLFSSIRGLLFFDFSFLATPFETLGCLLAIAIRVETALYKRALFPSKHFLAA
jgi:hypothetical protein